MIGFSQGFFECLCGVEDTDDGGCYKDCAHGRFTHTREPSSMSETEFCWPKPVFCKDELLRQEAGPVEV